MRGNFSDGGGGGILCQGELVLEGSVITNNDASTQGGGLSVGRASITDTTISQNSAGRGGGLLTGGPVALTRSSVRGNRATGPGGGIYNSGDLFVTNSTLSGNAGLEFGGGVYNAANLSLASCTLTQNEASRITAIDNFAGASLVLTNTIVYGNCGGDGLFTGSGSVEVPGGSCQVTNAMTELDLSLDSNLANNGGATLTHALLSTSLAVDRIVPAQCVGTNGIPLTTDQRGSERPSGEACDIGAFEVLDEP